MSCEGRAWLTNQPGVSLCIHVFWFGLWTASSEITGEGGAPAFVATKMVKKMLRQEVAEGDLYNEMFSKVWRKCFGHSVVEHGG